MQRAIPVAIWPLCLAFSLAFNLQAAPAEIVLNDDGGWCWFEDERALIQGNRLIVGTVANGAHDATRRGNIEITTYDLATGEISRSTLHQNFEADDHNSPALIQRPDGRFLALYSRHGGDNQIHSRISKNPSDAMAWLPGTVVVPTKESRVTYSNLHWLSRENGRKGRIYNFFRGYEGSFKPSWMFSDDLGETWTTGGLLIDFPAQSKHRPYVKYASDGKKTVHFLFTEAHPRNFDNSIYHAYYRDGRLHRGDGKAVRKLGDGPILPEEATRVFAGDANNVGWTQDLQLDDKGRPRAVFSVQKDSAGQPPGQGGSDHRYHYARWDGKRWLDKEIAYAGSRLYAGEDDYTGGICLHPDEPGTVFISTNVDPAGGTPLPSGHREIFQGKTPDGGKTWAWTALTENSTSDNLRPLVPKWKRGKTALLWLRGTLTTYRQYDLDVVLKVTGQTGLGRR